MDEIEKQIMEKLAPLYIIQREAEGKVIEWHDKLDQANSEIKPLQEELYWHLKSLGKYEGQR